MICARLRIRPSALEIERRGKSVCVQNGSLQESHHETNQLALNDIDPYFIDGD